MTVYAFDFANPLLFSIELFEDFDASLIPDICEAIGCGVFAENIQVLIMKKKLKRRENTG